MPLMNRREWVAGAGAALAAGPIWAAASQASSGPGFHRFALGDYRLTALDDGLWSLKIDKSFVRNAGIRTVNRALMAASLPPNVLPVSFTILLVDTGAKRILIDAGTAGQITDTAGTMIANLSAAGIEPATIDTVLISHFHPDHINGLKTKDGDKVFRNAEILAPEPEWAHWMDDGAMSRAPDRIKVYFRNARRIFGDIASEVRRFTPGATVAPGIVSIPAYGHTPGHTAFAIASGGQSMLAMGDAVRNPYLFARHPEWQPVFDMDGPLAAATRTRMLDRAAADGLLVQAYHFPFPACGRIVRAGAGYDFVRDA